MLVQCLTPTDPDFPPSLLEIASAPRQIYTLAHDLADLLRCPRIAIVGSRRVSPYGRGITHTLAHDLGKRGIVVVSGLALGVDAIAHQACLDAGGRTIAILPSGLDAIYPSRHTQLARHILERGGALISEYPEGMPALKQNFIARNRLVTGISDALLITEAAEKSGTLHTARFALEQGKEVMAVPGAITSLTSVGTNNLIKAGATLISSSDDVLFSLGYIASNKGPKIQGSNTEEQTLLDLIQHGTSDGHELQVTSRLEVPVFNQTLTMLEITGKISALGGNHWGIRP